MPAPVQKSPSSTAGDPSEAAYGDSLAVIEAPDDLTAEHVDQLSVAHGAHKNLWEWFHEGHWLGKWRSPLLVRLWRYSAGSVLAFVSSGVALFVCIQWLGLGATVSAVIAFFVGAVPNWALNRRWAWEKTERDGIGFETTLYVIVSLVSLAVSVAVTKGTALAAQHLSSQTFKHLLVTGMYLLATVALSGAKYVAYDRWVFVDRRRSRSRHQVPSTTDAKRRP